MQQIIEMAKGFDWSPFWISLKTGIVATVICFFLGLFAARKVLKMGPKARAVVDGILTLPMVMAPTVAGFFLLLLFSLRRPIGAFLYEQMGIKVVQTWLGCIIAASVIAFPLMYRNARAAFEQVDPDLIYAARTLGMKERTIVVDGFSKSYAMTGWRLGWAMGPKELMRHICKIHQFGIMSAPTTAQFAGIEAIRTGDDDIARMRDQYDLRRRFLLGELRSMGLDCFEPEGAFYIFPSIESTGLSSEEFCERLLHEQEVAVIPGSAFGASGEGHVRISYSYSMKHLREACSRMRKFLENLKNEQK